MNLRGRKGPPVPSPRPSRPMLTAAIDDPVPADSTLATIEPTLCASPHFVEREVQRALLSHPELSFSSLVVRRVPGGVCLEGVMEVDDDGPDVTALARRVSGVERVINHLLVRARSSLVFADAADE